MMQYPPIQQHSLPFGPPSPQPPYGSMPMGGPARMPQQPQMPPPGTVKTRTAVHPQTGEKVDIPFIAYLAPRPDKGTYEIEWKQADQRPLEMQIREAQQHATMVLPDVSFANGGISDGPQVAVKESKDLERRVSEWRKGTTGTSKEDKKRKKESAQWAEQAGRGYMMPQHAFPSNARDQEIENAMKSMHLGDPAAAEREQQRIRRLSGGVLGLSSSGKPRSRPPTPEGDRVQKFVPQRDLYFPTAGGAQSKGRGGNIMDFSGGAAVANKAGMQDYYGVPAQPVMDPAMMAAMKDFGGERQPDRSSYNMQSYITPPPSQPSSVHAQHMMPPNIMQMGYLDPSPQMRGQTASHSPYGHSPVAPAGNAMPFHSPGAPAGNVMPFHSPARTGIPLGAGQYAMPPGASPYGVSPAMGMMGGGQGGVDLYPPDHILAGQPMNASHQNEYSPMPSRPPAIVPTSAPQQQVPAAYMQGQYQQQQQQQQPMVDPRMMAAAAARGGNIMDGIPAQPSVVPGMGQPSSRASSSSYAPRPSPQGSFTRNETSHILPGTTGPSGFGLLREETPSDTTARSASRRVSANVNRPISTAIKVEPFPPFIVIPDLNYPLSKQDLPLPIVLSDRDVGLTEWDALITAILQYWAERDPALNKYNSAVKKICKVLDFWNTAFLNKRGLDFVLFRGNERRSGDRKGQVDQQLQFEPYARVFGDSDDSEEEDDSEESDEDLYAQFGGMDPATAHAMKQKKRMQSHRSSRTGRDREQAHSIAIFPVHMKSHSRS